MHAVQTPEYLYKILSYRHWKATERRCVVATPKEDDPFIHLSTADQLSRILEKYWPDAPQYVVLKIDPSRVEGEMKFETNPGGTTRYYHLYNGCIPIQAVVEATVRFREPLQQGACEGLEIVQAGHPSLRRAARELSKEEILTPDIQTLIQEMIASMREAPGVGLAAPQIGRAIQLAVIEDMDQSHLTQEQIEERDRRKVPLHVIINPKLTIEDAETVSFFEGCLSVPTFLGVVPRAKAVRVDCLNEKGEPAVIRAKGWHARILQHEIDHLHGKLFIDRALQETLMTDENYLQLWCRMPVEAVCDTLCDGGDDCK